MLAPDVAGRHSCKLNCADHSVEVFVLLIEVTEDGKHLRQAGRIARCMSPEMQVSNNCLGNAGSYVGVDHPPGKGI